MAKYCPNKPGDQQRLPRLGKHRLGARQCALLVLVALTTASCGKGGWFQSEAGPGTLDYLAGFRGGVAADEPRAAMVARDILAAGGSAGDAAAAAALAYAVTYPSGAGLGGGGLCVAADPVTKKAETIEFPAIAAKAGGPIAIPAFVRGIGLLQSKYGRLRWEAVVTPAEQLARFGDPASRAFVQAAVETQPSVTDSPALQTVFGTRTGQVPQEGERRTQLALATILAKLRTAGPNELYQGNLAQTLLADIAAAGGKVTAEELRDYAAAITKPIEVPFENAMTLYAPNNAAGGAIAAWLVEQSYDGGSFFRSSNIFSDNYVHSDKFAASLGQAYRSEPATLPMNGYGSSSVAVMDSRGGAVACVFSMSLPYGARLVGRETGILFAPPPGLAGDETPHLTAMLGFVPRTSQSFIAAAGSGGAPSAAATAYSVLQVALGKSKKDPAGPALEMPRLFQANPQAPLLVEPGTDPAIYKDMQQRGVTVNEIGRLGRVNLAYCSGGLPREPASCSFAADRRGYGVAFGRNF